VKIKVKLATSLWDSFFGLIDKRNTPPMQFRTRFGIHTFFLSYPIDILVLDSELRVKVTKKNLLPFNFFFYNPTYYNVIELEAGFIAKNKINLGDKIELTA